MERRRSLACFNDEVLTARSPWLLAAARRERTWSLVGAAMDMCVRVSDLLLVVPLGWVLKELMLGFVILDLVPQKELV